MSQKIIHYTNPELNAVIQCEKIEYEIPGGFYTTTKFLWACAECGLKWFSRDQASHCKGRKHVKNYPTSRFMACSKGVLCLERTSKMLEVLKTAKSRQECFDLVKEFKSYQTQLKFIKEYIKQNFPKTN